MTTTATVADLAAIERLIGALPADKRAELERLRGSQITAVRFDMTSDGNDFGWLGYLAICGLCTGVVAAAVLW